MQPIGRNILYKIEDDKLFIEIDMTAEKIPSKSGKSMIIASSHGNKRVIQNQDIFLGLNLYEKIQKKVEDE